MIVINRIIQSLRRKEVAVSALTFGFYLCLWIFNPTNRLIIPFFILLIMFYVIFFRNIRLALIAGYISSLIIETGKTFELQLIPPGSYHFSPIWYPNGYVVKLPITPALILGFLLGLLLIYDIVKKYRSFALTSIDLIILLLSLWRMIAAMFGSPEPIYSLAFWLFSLPVLFAYFSIRLYLKPQSFYPVLVGIILGCVAFLSVISFQQFIIKSPVGKNIESQLTIEDFGDAVDELRYSFRPVGTMTHANNLGAQLAIVLPFLASYSMLTPLLSVTIGMILCLVTLILTLSRSAWLSIGSLSILFLIFYFQRIQQVFSLVNKRYVFLVYVVFLFFFIEFVFPRLAISVNSFSDTGGGWYVRSRQIETSFSLINLHPIFGVGNAMSVPESLRIDPNGPFADFPAPVHNIFLLETVENGIPYLILFLMLLGNAGAYSFTQLKKHQSNPLIYAISFSVLSGVISIIIIGMLQPILMLQWWLPAVGLLLNISDHEMEKTGTI